MAQVNGEKRSDVDGRTLAEALAADGLDATRVACELNGRIVGHDAYAATVLEEDDVLEVVRFVGGG